MGSERHIFIELMFEETKSRFQVGKQEVSYYSFNFSYFLLWATVDLIRAWLEFPVRVPVISARALGCACVSVRTSLVDDLRAVTCIGMKLLCNCTACWSSGTQITEKGKKADFLQAACQGAVVSCTIPCILCLVIAVSCGTRAKMTLFSLILCSWS